MSDLQKVVAMLLILGFNVAVLCGVVYLVVKVAAWAWGS